MLCYEREPVPSLPGSRHTLAESSTRSYYWNCSQLGTTGEGPQAWIQNVSTQPQLSEKGHAAQGMPRKDTNPKAALAPTVNAQPIRTCYPNDPVKRNISGLKLLCSLPLLLFVCARRGSMYCRDRGTFSRDLTAAFLGPQFQRERGCQSLKAGAN